MNKVKLFSFCVVVTLSLAANRAHAQQVSTKSATTTKQTTNEKPESKAIGSVNKEVDGQNERAETKPATVEQTYPQEKRRWQIKVTTGEKWYQLSVKLEI
jgi:hypothetical protein